MGRFYLRVILVSSLAAALVSSIALFGYNLCFHKEKKKDHIEKKSHHSCDWYSVTEKLPRLGQIVWVYVPYCDSGERVSIAKYDDDMEHCFFIDLETHCSWEEDDVVMWKKMRYPDEPDDI